jgi:hypothetical protein
MVDEADISTFRKKVDAILRPHKKRVKSSTTVVAHSLLFRGIVPSEEIKKRVGEPNLHQHGTVRLEAHADTNPIRPAEQRYIQEHGSVEYAQLLGRLFDALFPPE